MVDPRATLVGLRPSQLEQLLAAGDEVRECVRILEKSGANVVSELLRDQGEFYEWDHYPKGDVYDPASHAQYYYHAHPDAASRGEHGHFHTFLRPKGMPPRVAPAPVGPRDPTADPDAALSHLVGISMDVYGAPIALFTTNRWVTGETWYAARDVIAMLDRFAIDLAQPSWPVNRWISAMLRLFRPQAEMLIRRRDARMAEWARAHPDRDIYEDRDLDVTSEIPISVDEQYEQIEAALRRARARGA